MTSSARRYWIFETDTILLIGNRCLRYTCNLFCGVLCFRCICRIIFSLLVHTCIWYKMNKLAQYLDSIIPFQTDIGRYCSQYRYYYIFWYSFLVLLLRTFCKMGMIFGFSHSSSDKLQRLRKFWPMESSFSSPIQFLSRDELLQLIPVYSCFIIQLYFNTLGQLICPKYCNTVIFWGQ